MCSKCVKIAVAVYVAGVAYELYAIPATDTAKNQKAFGWPYYFLTGLFGVVSTQIQQIQGPGTIGPNNVGSGTGNGVAGPNQNG